MKVDIRPRKRNAPRPVEKSAPGFLQWLRGRPCILCNVICIGKIEAAHLDFAGGKGIGTKVADAYAVPMCSGHHTLQHHCGWDTFCKDNSVTKPMLLDASTRFWNAWPGRRAWERKQDA